MPTPRPSYTHQILPIFFIILLHYQSTSSSASRSLININGHENPTTDFIKESCNYTTYPDLCYSTLANYANQVQNSPKELACAALNATRTEAQTASRMLKSMSKGRVRGNTRGKDGGAMKDCMEMLKDALDELKMSVEEMERASPEVSDFRFHVNNVQTWVSAALTDDDTCMDGLKQGGWGHRNDKSYTSIHDEVVKVAHLTSVALALINNYAASVNY